MNNGVMNWGRVWERVMSQLITMGIIVVILAIMESCG